jgi:hypothetical protein
MTLADRRGGPIYRPLERDVYIIIRNEDPSLQENCIASKLQMVQLIPCVIIKQSMSQDQPYPESRTSVPGVTSLQGRV